MASHGLYECAMPYPEFLMTMLFLLAPNQDGLVDNSEPISDVLHVFDTTLIRSLDIMGCKGPELRVISRQPRHLFKEPHIIMQMVAEEHQLSWSLRRMCK